MKQQDVCPQSTTILKCRCDNCEVTFVRNMSSIKGSTTLCGRDCRNQYLKRSNPNLGKEKINVNCEVCNTDIKVNPSKYKKQSYFLCSRECYKRHRSKKYSGDNVYNYQGLFVPCEYCGDDFKTIEYDINNRNHLFCSPQCYHLFRKENFKEVYFSTLMNDSRQETVPERLTREYLEKNYIPCTQEHPIENTYFADFYLNEYKSIIEVYGDYWHVNPKIYGINKREVNEFQKEKIKKDKQRMNFLKNRGYSVYVIWESEIKENIDYYLGKIISEIINKQESATTVRQTLQLYVEE